MNGQQMQAPPALDAAAALEMLAIVRAVRAREAGKVPPATGAGRRGGARKDR